MVDRAGNVIGVAVSTLRDTSQQNVNFAINMNVLTAFLDSNGVAYSTEASEHTLSNVEVAEAARSIAVLITVEK